MVLPESICADIPILRIILGLIRAKLRRDWAKKELLLVMRLDRKYCCDALVENYDCLAKIEVNIYGLVFIIGRAYSRVSYSRKI